MIIYYYDTHSNSAIEAQTSYFCESCRFSVIVPKFRYSSIVLCIVTLYSVEANTLHPSGMMCWLVFNV